MRRAILGGTFDPPHIAHLVAADAALRQLDLDAVTFIPAGRPWQKAGEGVTPAVDRWEMTLRAIDAIDAFEADDREVLRDGWSYTIDTLEGLGDEEVVLVLGADAAAGLPTWHRADEVIERVTLAVMPRDGTPRTAVEAVGARVEWLDVPELPVSGTMLRDRHSRGLGIRFLVREAVYGYIVEHGLYVPA